MTQSLHTALREILDGWREDLPAAWADFLVGVGPDPDRIDPALELDPWEPVFPVRRGRQLPGQPEGAHMLRAFDGPPPDAVKCVILGQDPYPSPAIASGRAFEAGGIAEWSELDKMFTKSLRAWALMLVVARHGRDHREDGFDAWPALRDALAAGDIAFEAPADIASRQEREGVLLLNASLTLTRFQVAGDPHQLRGHMPLWRPLMIGLLQRLAARGDPIVLMGFGRIAASIIEAAGIAAGRAGNTASLVRPHPAEAEAFLALPNPFLECNRHLEAMGTEPIAW